MGYRQFGKTSSVDCPVEFAEARGKYRDTDNKILYWKVIPAWKSCFDLKTVLVDCPVEFAEERGKYRDTDNYDLSVEVLISMFTFLASPQKGKTQKL